MNLGIAGRRGLVTGASCGIGRAVARTLAEEGVDTVLVARRREQLDDAATEIASTRGRRPHTIAADVADPDACRRIAEELGPRGVDILVNNVGGGDLAPVLTVADDTVDHLFQLNYRAATRLAASLVPSMNGWGRVVNIASIAAREPHPNSAHYGAAKAALVTYGKALAAEAGPSGVTVNTVLPGFTATEQFESAIDMLIAARGWTREEAIRRLAGRNEQPLGRLGRPSDVADAVLFLVSERAAWITGTTLVVDGGGLRGVW